MFKFFENGALKKLIVQLAQDLHNKLLVTKFYSIADLTTVCTELMATLLCTQQLCTVLANPPLT